MASTIQTPVILNDQIENLVQIDQPWLLLNGKHTPEDHLKTLTSLWDSATWERYLCWYETPRAESILSTREYDEICENSTENIFVNAQSSADDELKEQVNAYISNLSHHQRRIVYLFFWEGRSERFIANLLLINQSTVNRVKKTALKKIKYLAATCISSRIMKGKVDFAPLTTGDSNGAAELAKGVFSKAS